MVQNEAVPDGCPVWKAGQTEQTIMTYYNRTSVWQRGPERGGESSSSRQFPRAAAAAAAAKAEAEARKEREAREALERGERDRQEALAAQAKKEAQAVAKAARAPDKVKLLELASKFEAISYPTMKTDNGREVLEEFKAVVNEGIELLRKLTGAL